MGHLCEVFHKKLTDNGPSVCIGQVRMMRQVSQHSVDKSTTFSVYVLQLLSFYLYIFPFNLGKSPFSSKCQIPGLTCLILSVWHLRMFHFVEVSNHKLLK